MAKRWHACKTPQHTQQGNQRMIKTRIKALWDGTRPKKETAMKKTMRIAQGESWPLCSRTTLARKDWRGKVLNANQWIGRQFVRLHNNLAVHKFQSSITAWVSLIFLQDNMDKNISSLLQPVYIILQLKCKCLPIWEILLEHFEWAPYWVRLHPQPVLDWGVNTSEQEKPRISFHRTSFDWQMLQLHWYIQKKRKS